ncbi:hypothetical protein HPB52_024152 [Rhipicephalus sanguineus]|uniref:Uncharacterized protein n=1 Tax=Rhipicephalus sanguineus TaxID=34632 RepID=A0A9D4Q8Y1_RHISA|nr:hypothetical protein HPB52_024152 [Rhipicephalus sanguineus]
MSQPCQKRDTRTCDMVAPKHGMKNGFLKHLKCGFSCAAPVARSNSAEDLLTGRSARARQERSRKRSATDLSARGLTMCIDKPQDRARVSSSPEGITNAEMPPKQKNHRRRRRRAKPMYAPPTPAAVPQNAAGIRIERSPTKQDLIFCVESTSPSKMDLKKQGGDEAPCASKASPPYVNSAIAFILGGNDDLSDTSSDWDEVDDCAAGSNFAVDVLMMPLLNSLLSVSALSDSCPLRRCNGDQVDGPRPSMSPLVRNANEKWNRNYYGEDLSRPPRSAKVSFPVGDQLVEVHNADDLERKGPWEQIAVDRRRFQSRIASVESVLAPVLSLSSTDRRFLRQSTGKVAKAHF